MKNQPLLFSIVLSACFALPARADTVFVKAGDKSGVGITRSSGSECFVVTSDHILGNITTVSVVGYRGLRATAAKEISYFGDIAILHVSPGGAELCGGQRWEYGENQSLKPSMHWQIEGSNADGSGKMLDAALVDADDRFVNLKLLGPTNPNYRGMNGSLIKADGQPVGIFVELTTGANGEQLGRGYRLRYLKPDLDRFFSAGDTFSGLYGNWQYSSGEQTKTDGSCVQKGLLVTKVTMKPTDVEQGKLTGDVEQIYSYEALSGCNLEANGGRPTMILTYRFQWVVSSSSSSEFKMISKYAGCSGPNCSWKFGDLPGSLTLNGGNVVFKNEMGSATLTKQ
jgi:hypothetical protein